MAALDPRLTLARGDIAAAELEGLVPARRYVQPQARRCIAPAVPLRGAPDADGEQATQLLFGEIFEVLEEAHGWAFGQSRRDRYVGYVRAGALGAAGDFPTHWVSALRTFAFAEPNLKTPIRTTLSMNSLVRIEAEDGRFALAADAGWVFKGHLTAIGEGACDHAGVALQFLGAPYQWGGRESLGLDCSALVQNALHAVGRTCPRDSDQQFAELGAPVEAQGLARGDLVFWKGHVSIMTDAEMMVHANGHHMAVTHEPLAPAIARIREAGAGDPLGYRRLPPL